MKYFYIVLITLFLSANVKAQNVYIPDPNFRAFLNANYSSAMVAPDSLNPNAPIVLSTTILDLYRLGINNLTGITAFVNLDSLKCPWNNLTFLPTLPLNLRSLSCDFNQLTSLPVLPPSLQYLSCGHNYQLGSLPSIPSSLKTLYCNYNGLVTLPVLPSTLQILTYNGNHVSNLLSFPTSLTVLDCGYNQLTTLPVLPINLSSFSCPNNLLTSLPTLPTSLQLLNCTSNLLITLPTLPSSLVELWCDNNQLTSLPALPNLHILNYGYNPLVTAPILPLSLTSLSCSGIPNLPIPILPPTLISLFCNSMGWSSLPTLPSTLKLLACSQNQIQTIPSLPSSLQRLLIPNNLITYLPSLPLALQEISCDFNPITCLPFLPPNVYRLTAPSSSCIPNLPFGCSNFNNTPICSPTAICVQASFVKGVVFSDINLNGIKDSGESLIQNITLSSSSGNSVVFSNANGIYTLPEDTGITFTVSPNITLYRTLSTNLGTHNFSNYGVIDTSDIGIYETPNVNDLQLSQTTFGVVRPFGIYTTKLRCFNIGTTTQSGQIYFVKDPTVSFISSTPSSSSVSGDTIFWNFTSLLPLNNFDVNIQLQVPITVPLGATLQEYAAVVGAANDSTPSNNFIAITLNVVNSFDPNEKTAEPSVLTPTQIANRQKITYTVFFQNTGTADAINVSVRDTLSNNLDLTTFKMESESHDISSWYIANRILVVRFDSIMLPDSNANEPASHGFFKYSVKPVSTLQVGDQIDNTAYIYFDYNSPVVTNTTHTSVFTSIAATTVSGHGDMNIYPNPANDFIHVESYENISELIVTNLLGQQIFKQEIKNKKSLDLNVHRYPEGIYLVRIKTEKGFVVRKFIKE